MNVIVLAHFIYLTGSWLDWMTTVRSLDSGGYELNGFIRRFINKLPWDTEYEIAFLKLAVYLGLILSHAPAEMFFVAGGIQTVAAMGNQFGWWTKVLFWIKSFKDMP